MSEWQTIDTAPKDGTIIDVWLQEPLQDIKFYCSSEPLYIEPDKYGGRSAGWFWDTDKFRPYLRGLRLPVFVRPTHWMHLPDAPK